MTDRVEDLIWECNHTDDGEFDWERFEEGCAIADYWDMDD